jgi:glycosyltransferase involved in cell wall biosynthesis
MRKQTLEDKLISSLIAMRYRLMEPALLRLNRFRYKKHYNDSKDQPLISITIPTYDRGRLLVDRTLPSILAQTYKNFEVIIVGDHCIDDTSEILKEVKDPRVKFINLSKRTKYPEDPTLRWFVSGVAPSNHALKIAKGKWITYFDDDDIMVPDFLESLLEFAIKSDCEFVAGLYEEESEGVCTIKGQVNNHQPEFGGHSTWLYRSYLRFFKYNLNSWRKSYNCPQDIDMQLRMKKSGVIMKSFNKVVSYVRPRPGLSAIGLKARLVEKKEV